MNPQEIFPCGSPDRDLFELTCHIPLLQHGIGHSQPLGTFRMLIAHPVVHVALIFHNARLCHRSSPFHGRSSPSRSHPLLGKSCPAANHLS